MLSKIKWKSKIADKSEEMIYKKAKMPFIVPELREDIAEWEFIKTANRKSRQHADLMAQLIPSEDIKGVVHNHTT